ncbi:MAG: ATP-binding protein [Bacillota bacterium]|nr:ATP-binding protein [Bacillota bacterium]
MRFGWLIVFAILTFMVSILYFYMFSRRQEKFMRFWGFSWVAYSCSLLCLLCYLNGENEFFLEVRKVIDMFNLLLLLFGTYSFIHVRIPTYWYRFSLYLLLLAVICIIYSFELLSFYLPISVYQIVLTLFICYNVSAKWSIPRGEKTIASAVFLIWGVSKSVFSIAEIFMQTTYNLYITEILLSNVVNFCILTIYVVYTRKESDLASNLYKTVVENSHDAIFYYKLKPYEAFEYISPSIESLTGFRPANFYDNPRFYLNLVTGNQVNEIQDIFSDSSTYRNESILELTKKSGEKFWGQFNCTVIKDDSGTFIEGTLRDITRMKSAEMEHLEVTRSRNMLLSYISHELRTPITAIAGYLTAIGDGTMSSEEDKQEAMEIITSKTLTLKKLIDDLDQLSKLETHQFTFNFMSCTTKDAVELLLNNNLGDLKSADFQVDIRYDSNQLKDYWIIADLDRINQVFSNLLTNASKYSRGEKKLLLEFSIDDAKENFIASVKDWGIGIMDKDVAHVFDRFYRADYRDNSDLRTEGRGLGLTLCKEIMTAHQGDIYAESLYGEWTKFTFIIPLYPM